MILVKTHFTCILYTEHQSQVSAPGPMALLFPFSFPHIILNLYYDRQNFRLVQVMKAFVHHNVHVTDSRVVFERYRKYGGKG